MLPPPTPVEREVVNLPTRVITVAKTPPEFPLGKRGERPVTITLDPREAELLGQYGATEDYAGGIPGVVVRGFSAKFAWDAAQDVASVLEDVELTELLQNMLNERLSIACPMPGKDAYKQLEFSKARYQYQAEAILYLFRRAYALLGDPPRCLSGETEILINRGGNARKYKLRDVFFKFNGGQFPCGGNKSSLVWWDPNIPSMSQSWDGDGNIRLNEILNVYESGLKMTFSVRTKTGRQIRGSADHRFMTSEGWKKLSELQPGDLVRVAARPVSKGKKNSRPSDCVGCCWHHPYARHGIQNRKNRAPERRARVLRHRLIVEAHMNGLTFEEFKERVRTGQRLEGLKFLDPDAYHVHHKNGNYKDNRIENLDVLSETDHLRGHGEETHWKHVVTRCVFDEIVSIEEYGEEMTYDIEMKEPHHNFVASEFVVHNSGKSPVFLVICVLADAKRVLILCPAMVKYVWAEEVAKWLNEEATLLFGRAADELRVFCKVCRGARRIDTGATDEEGFVIYRPCVDCKAKNGQPLGEKLYLVRDLVPDRGSYWWNDEPSEEEMTAWRAKVEDGETRWAKKLSDFQAKEAKRFADWEKKNPKRRKPFVPKDPPERPKNTLPPDPPKGQKHWVRFSVWPPTFRCPQHDDITSTKPGKCSKCREELNTVLKNSRFVVCNADLVHGERGRDIWGKRITLEHLPGWGQTLASLRFDVCGADEAHRYLRYGKQKGDKDAVTRRDAVVDCTDEIPRCYALTGTPTMGFTRDLYGILDWLSKGLWS